MGEVLCVTSASGGTGKTLLTANVGAALALRENSVLLLDASLSFPGLDAALGMEKRAVYDLADILESGCRISEALLRVSAAPQLYFLPAPVHRRLDPKQAGRFGQLLTLFRKNFDYVLADVPAEDSPIRDILFSEADLMIFLSMNDRRTSRNTKRMLTLIPEYKKTGLVLNRVLPGMIRNGDMMSLDETVKETGVPLLGAVCCDEGIRLRDSEGKLSAGVREGACRAFSNIAGRIAGEDIPLDLRGKH